MKWLLITSKTSSSSFVFIWDEILSINRLLNLNCYRAQTQTISEAVWWRGKSISLILKELTEILNKKCHLHKILLNPRELRICFSNVSFMFHKIYSFRKPIKPMMIFWLYRLFSSSSYSLFSYCISSVH